MNISTRLWYRQEKCTLNFIWSQHRGGYYNTFMVLNWWLNTTKHIHKLHSNFVNLCNGGIWNLVKSRYMKSHPFSPDPGDCSKQWQGKPFPQELTDTRTLTLVLERCHWHWHSNTVFWKEASTHTLPISDSKSAQFVLFRQNESYQSNFWSLLSKYSTPVD